MEKKEEEEAKMKSIDSFAHIKSKNTKQEKHNVCPEQQQQTGSGASRISNSDSQLYLQFEIELCKCRFV